MVLVFHILSDSIMFPKDKSEALVDGNIATNKINHQMIYPLTFLGYIPHVFYELRENCPVLYSFVVLVSSTSLLAYFCSFVMHPPMCKVETGRSCTQQG